MNTHEGKCKHDESRDMLLQHITMFHSLLKDTVSQLLMIIIVIQLILFSSCV